MTEAGRFIEDLASSVEKGRAFLEAMIADLVEGLIALFPDLGMPAP